MNDLFSEDRYFLCLRDMNDLSSVDRYFLCLGDMNDLTSEDRNKLLEEQKKNNEYHR